MFKKKYRYQQTGSLSWTVQEREAGIWWVDVYRSRSEEVAKAWIDDRVRENSFKKGPKVYYP